MSCRAAGPSQANQKSSDRSADRVSKSSAKSGRRSAVRSPRSLVGQHSSESLDMEKLSTPHSLEDLKRQVRCAQRHRYTHLTELMGTRQRVQAIVGSLRFDALVGLVICGNIGVLCFESNYNAGCQDCDSLEDPTLQTFTLINMVFLAIYVAELSLRFYVERQWFFFSGWNIFDFLIVVISAFDGLLIYVFTNPGQMQWIRVFRIARLARAIRLVSVFPELYSMLMGFASAMAAMFWGFVMIVASLIVFSIFTVDFAGPAIKRVHEDQDGWCANAFGTVQDSILFYFQTLVAGDAWGTCIIPLIRENYLWSGFFAFILVCVQLGFMNLILSVIVDAAAGNREASAEEKQRQREQAEREFTDRLLEVLASIDTDGSGLISSDELLQGASNNPEMAAILGELSIDVEMLDQLFTFMDKDGSGEVSYEEFVATIRKSKEYDVKTMLMIMQLSLARLINEVRWLKPGQREQDCQDAARARSPVSVVPGFAGEASASCGDDLPKKVRDSGKGSAGAKIQAPHAGAWHPLPDVEPAPPQKEEKEVKEQKATEVSKVLHSTSTTFISGPEGLDRVLLGLEEQLAALRACAEDSWILAPRIPPVTSTWRAHPSTTSDSMHECGRDGGESVANASVMATPGAGSRMASAATSANYNRSAVHSSSPAW